MQNVIEPSIENLLLELKRRATEDLVTNADAFEELVDELLAEKIEWGEINEDDDVQVMREDLIARWTDVERFIRSNETERP
jgi:hypothetical protein